MNSCSLSTHDSAVHCTDSFTYEVIITEIKYVVECELSAWWISIICMPLRTSKKKGKANPVTEREGPYVCKTSRFAHILDNRITDGGDAYRLPFASRKIPRAHFS
jgi:hypothetical protein